MLAQAYNRTKMLERRHPVMEDWGRFLDGETETAKVVPRIAIPAAFEAIKATLPVGRVDA
jgi:hypothetical protein